MAAVLDFFSTYTLLAIMEQVVPMPSFFRSRYFPTGADDIFASDKVLTEYRDGDQKMAAFVAPRVGDIVVERIGYEVRELEPAYVGLSRILSHDDLKKRGFGEALYANSTPAERAMRLQMRDMTDLDNRILRLEEYMCAQTMVHNGFDMQEYIDAKTKGEVKHVQFYTGTSDHTYTVATKWNAAGEKGKAFFGDVKAMCKALAKRGIIASDLVLGCDVGDAILGLEEVKERLNKNSGIITGTVDPALTQYPGVTYIGTMNFGGHKLNIFEVDEMVKDMDGNEVTVFPATSAMVTYPGCGHMMYGQINQIDYGASDFATYHGKRVPKLVVDQENDLRKLRLGARPLAAPLQKSPYIYAANVVG